MRIKVGAFGPITEADITFGDLTVLVGPQATGKSILLQLFKLVLDRRSIHAEMRRFGLEWGTNLDEFLQLYFGEGMSRLWQANRSSLRVNGRATDLAGFARSYRGRRAPADETLFYVPAQRVMSMRDGLTRPFSQYNAGDPFVLRAFSDKLHHLIQTDFATPSTLFPKRNRMNETLRRPLAEHVFGGFKLKTEVAQMQRRIVLESRYGTVLPYLVWSAGQREFVPLLLGFYHLLPSAGTPRRESLEWVVIEGLETGLHPFAISSVLSVVGELLARGYRVCLSTHSTYVLDLVWALRFIQDNEGKVPDVRRLLSLGATQPANELARAALNSQLRVYYFTRGGTVQDISSLDPGSDDDAERDWGGLTEFAGIAGDIVAEVANRRG